MTKHATTVAIIVIAAFVPCGVLGATATFTVAVSADDGYVEKKDSSYPPPGVVTSDTSSADLSATRMVGGDYQIDNLLVRWDTSSLPAGASIQSVAFRCFVDVALNDDHRNLTADWYATWPIDPASYSQTAQTTALVGYTLDNAVAATGAYLTIPLDNASGISLTGYTGLRFHVDGGEPAGVNAFLCLSLDEGTHTPPQLIITYTANTAPTLTSVTPSPATSLAGATISFASVASDPDSSDTLSLYVCKANDATSSGCGSGGTWCSVTAAVTNPTCSYTTARADGGTKNYYAFLFDSTGAAASANPQSGSFTVSVPGGAGAPGWTFHVFFPVEAPTPAPPSTEPSATVLPPSSPPPAMTLQPPPRDLTTERSALHVFVDFFRRLPLSADDWRRLHAFAYGCPTLLPRDLNAERQALVPFGQRFGRMPRSSADWSTLHTLAYCIQ